MLKNKSWKTSAGGVGMILTGLGMIGSVLTKVLAEGSAAIDEPALTAVMTGVGTISGGVALLFARDNDKSSEDVGKK